MSPLSNYLGRAGKWLKGKSNGSRPGLSEHGSVSKDTPLSECPFAVFDTELSGLDARKDFIVSVGAIRMTGGIIHLNSEYYSLVRPEGEMTKKSVEIHGIIPGELAEEKAIDQILPEFLDIVQGRVLIGHFIHIDIKFINRALKQRMNRKLENPAVDTHSVHEWLSENSQAFRKHYRGGSGKSDLFSVAEQYGITITATHNALSDAFITAQLFQRFLYFIHSEGLETLGELMDIGKA